MSTKKKTKKVPGEYKRGYAGGVRAAVDALLDDLDAHGLLHVEVDDDGRAVVCTGCVLAEHHFPRLAARWEFVTGIGHAGPPAPPEPQHA